MAGRNTSAEGPIADTAPFDKSMVVQESEVKDAMSEVDKGRSKAADRLEDAASTVHERADELPGGPRVKEFAHAAADRLSTTADYVRDHDARRMMADVETAVKNNPGPALLIAAAFGFVLGRALTRD